MTTNPVNRGDLLGRLRKDYLEHSLDKTEQESIIFQYKKEENDEKAEGIFRIILNMPKREEALKSAGTLREVILACPETELKQSELNPYVLLLVLEKMYTSGVVKDGDAIRFLGGILTQKHEKEYRKIGSLCSKLGIEKKKAGEEESKKESKEESREKCKEEREAGTGKEVNSKKEAERKKVLRDFLTNKDGILGLFQESLIKDIVNNFWPREIRNKTGKVAIGEDLSGLLETEEADLKIDVSAAASLKWNYRDDIRLLNYYLSKTKEQDFNTAGGDVLTDSSFIRDWEDFYAKINRPSRGPFTETFLIYVRPDSLVSLWIMGNGVVNRNGLLEAGKGIRTDRNYYYVLKAEYTIEMDDAYEDGRNFIFFSSQYVELFTDLTSALARMNSSDFTEKSTENLTNLDGSLSANMDAVMEYEKIRSRQLGRIRPTEADRKIAEEYAKKERKGQKGKKA